MKIPKDFPVQPLGPNENPPGRTTCGTCGRSWDDDIATAWTPAPSARCPFEYYHDEEEDEDEDESEPDLVAELIEALEAATERMESVAKRLPLHNRAKGVHPKTHVAHLAAHLEQHAKKARAAIAKATEG